MMEVRFLRGFLVLALSLLVGLSGCGGESNTAPSTSENAAGNTHKSIANNGGEGTSESANDRTRNFQPITLGESGSSKPGGADSQDANPTHHKIDNVLTAMQPLQVLLGKWRGVTSKAIAGIKAVEEPQWIWDFQTNHDQPALVLTSETSPYLPNGRLTYLTEDQHFQLTTKDTEGVESVYVGTWSQEPEDVAGDDNKLQRTFKLRLVQIVPDEGQTEFVFNQHDNNRYLLEVYRKRGEAAVRRIDTVGTQRQGTSFAINDTGYGEKTCIVSQGLGTIAVSHEGKSYWVCCSGCKAAFEEDPKLWIAKLAERKKK